MLFSCIKDYVFFLNNKNTLGELMHKAFQNSCSFPIAIQEKVFKGDARAMIDLGKKKYIVWINEDFHNTDPIFCCEVE